MCLLFMKQELQAFVEAYLISSASSFCRSQFLLIYFTIVWGKKSEHDVELAIKKNEKVLTSDCSSKLS